MSLDASTASAVPLSLKLASLPGAVGATLGPGPWRTIEQDRILAFANATGDHQWIHVDPERAAEGPFGAAIAHGYLTLSLVPLMLEELLHFTDRSSGINYGIDKVRFVHPVPAGGRVRLRGSLLSASPQSAGIQYRVGLIVELDGVDKPAMVGELIALGLP
jgi:acyl dehydratase